MEQEKIFHSKHFKLRLVGNSHVVNIPKEARDALNIQLGDEVTYIVKENGKVEIEKADDIENVDDLITQVVEKHRNTLDKLAHL
ncbi:AbrB/MazE/SpoVT family DNA-binding domain-containing protein [Enterococcus timonensis]|uniref:AbrB/MazE/SpoVT family DNA-binding domain-containing protein n=1 Tax=Enterococcus timonensis TaxID=1852364 RepID=UPI0008DA027C|nr:AbrB/MazE/SpoVT family DNA-binding domain-containing protein [Enterococcus timonensis]